MQDKAHNLSVHRISDYLIYKTDVMSGDVITHLKLQKLLYYAWAWYLTLHKKKLFAGGFVAWPHGPVCVPVYKRFKDKGYAPLVIKQPMNLGGIAEDVQEFLDEILDDYGKYSAKKLEDLTHKELPWQLAFDRGKTSIKEDEVIEFYTQQQREKEEEEDALDLLSIAQIKPEDFIGTAETQRLFQSLSCHSHCGA